MTEKEYRKIVRIHPVSLRKRDVQKIVHCISEHTNNERVNFTFKIGFGCEKIIYQTIEEMNDFNSDIPSEDLDLSTVIWLDNKIVKGISVRFYHNFVDYQIHSTNEAWFLGKQEQLNKILRERRPWYWVIKKIIPFSFAPLIMIGILLGLIGVKHNNLYSALLGTIIFSLSIIIVLLEFKQTIFPYVKITFNEKQEKKYLTYEMFTAVTALIMMITGLIDLVLKFSN